MKYSMLTAVSDCLRREEVPNSCHKWENYKVLSISGGPLWHRVTELEPYEGILHVPGNLLFRVGGDF